MNINRILQPKSYRVKQIGKTPRNTSGNTCNITTTSACNQSFQVGYNNQVNNLMEGTSNGSNQWTNRNRYRSGSNKLNQKNQESVIAGSDVKSLKNPKITIQVNNAEDIHKPYVDRGAMTIQTTKTVSGPREIQISSTKSKESKNFLLLNMNIKNSVTPT